MNRPTPAHRFLADENLPRVCVKRLRELGFDVEYVVDRGAGSLDPAVMGRAGETGRLLITEDRDFGTLVYAHHHPSPPGVIYLRLGDARAEEVADVLLAVVRSGLELIGLFTTVNMNGRVRQRPLPG